TAREPILLIHGTALDPANNFGWNWQPALEMEDRPYCTLALVNDGMGDAQESAERVVLALKEMNQVSGQKIDIVGYSQGGLIPRWGIQFFPEVIDWIDDFIAISPSNHGSLDADGLCQFSSCAASIWQQTTTSNLLGVLNADGMETVPQIDYTVIFTRYDQVVTPNFDSPLGAPSSPLRNEGENIVNIEMQSVCPQNVADHLTSGTSDALAYALAIDAADNDGVADPARLAEDICQQPFMPGVNPATAAIDFANLGVLIARNLASAERLPAEPSLRSYTQSN
ncbi:MAG: hypothetical protein R3194_13795, partial [Limnobacter sp.]|nr:hypothetical protein [Limnobacter sp.]